MTSAKEDRDTIKSLYGVSSQPGNGSLGRWKKQPTIIQPPTNPPGPSRIITQPGMNPFSSNPNNQKTRSNNNVGNPTARQTIASSNREDQGRPAKRQKREHTFGPQPTLSKTPIRKTNLGQRNRPPLAPEPVDVDEIESSEDERKRRRTSFQNKQSTDELNMLSPPASNLDVQHSIYSFTAGNDIAPDGAATVLNERRYGGSQNDSPGHDPIIDFTSDVESGHVKAEVAKIEGLRKVDLSKMQLRGKANKMQPKHTKNSLNKLSLRPTSINPDPIASSSTIYKTERKGKLDQTKLQLPIKETYLGSEFHPQQGDHSIALCWGSDKLSVKVNEVDIFTRIDGEWEGWECTYSNNPPLIQLRRKDGAKDPCVTIKFEHSSRSWKEADLVKLCGILRRRGLKPSKVNEGDRVWQMAEMFKQDQDHVDPSGRNRMKEHQIMRATRQIISPPKHQSTSVTSSGSWPESSKGMSSGPPPRRTRPSKMDQTADASNLRRSARTVVPLPITPAPDQDEVILVYPQGAPGAVNLTNGDLARLEPGEYLNDTLIEFGLKHWLGELETSNPEFASQIHVFNSFFYKKLVHKKDPEQAFESLRKWTSKFDIFQKKYIIVPINENFHWYLAIICEPEHVLIPTPDIPPKRKDTRSSVKHEVSLVPTTSALPENTPPTAAEDGDTTTSSITSVSLASDMTLTKQPSTPEDNSDDDWYQTMPSSEAEVERSLYNGFRCSLQIIDDDDQLPLVEGAVAAGDDDDDGLSYVSDKADIDTNSNPAEKSPSIMDENLDSGPSEVRMAVDDIEAIDAMELDEDDGPTTLKLAAVPPAQFYGSIKATGKQKAISKTNLRIVDVDKDEGDDVVVLDPAPKTYIFTLDSLGTRHPRAITKLATYLKLEAKDKKGIPNASLAQGKPALVPTQPNFCDCGVYLIHFVQTFMSDPKRYCHSILSQKTKKLINKERQVEWHDEKVAGMREDIATRIRKLSEVWRRERRLKVAKETDDGADKVNLVESSDSDIVVDDGNVVGPSPKKARAKRLRG